MRLDSNQFDILDKIQRETHMPLYVMNDEITGNDIIYDLEEDEYYELKDGIMLISEGFCNDNNILNDEEMNLFKQLIENCEIFGG